MSTHNLYFFNRNMKINVYPCKPQFYSIKVGLRGQNYIGVFLWWFAFLHTKPLIKNGLLYKERIRSLWEQILSL